MSVKISSLNTASTIDSGDDINIAGNNPLTFSDWGGGWFMQDGTYIRSLNQKSIWLGDGVLASQGGLSVGYGGTLPTAGYGIIAGRLGVGLNSPTARLDLTTDGNGTTAAYSGIHIRQNSTSVSEDVAARLTFNGDGGTTIYGFIEQRRNSYDSFALGTKNSTGSGAGYVSLYTQGNESVRISGGGNVLIGTTTDAGYKLDVNGTGRFSGDITISGQRIKELTSTNKGIYIGNWGGAGYWGLGSTATSHELKLDQVNQSTGAWEGATDVNLYLGSNRLVIHSGNIGSQSVSYATTAGTANAVAWANISSIPNEIFNYDGWVNSPGYDANTIAGNKSGFTYSNNAPYTGPLTHFAASGYGLQFNASYSGGGTGIGYRTRNGDTATWNSWYTIITTANISSYALTVAGGFDMTGSFGLNDNKLYLRTNNDNNHYIWNAADDWEEIVPYFGTGLRIKSSNGSVLATFSISGNSMDITGNAATATTANAVYLGGNSNYTITNNSWAGAAGYHGYSYTGGNYRFGFSSTSGYIDVYTDGNFYAGIDLNGSNNLVLHTGNYTTYAATADHTHNLGRYSLAAPANIDALTTTNFRNTLFGNTSNTWNISTARWNTTPTALPGMNSYGTMLAWSGADTQGFIATDYSTANITVGGGNASNINWSALLLHSSNYSSYALPLSGGNLTGLVQSTANIEATAFRTDGNFELTSGLTGLKSNYYDTRFYASNTSYWNVTTAAAATNGALLFRQGYEGTTKGYVYWDSSGFGLLNNVGGWSVRANYGSSYGGSLFGSWVVRSMTVDSGLLSFYTSTGVTKGSVAWDDQGFGLYNNQNDYSLICNQGSSFGGLLIGTWSSTGDFNIAGANLSINSNASATYANITYSSSLDPVAGHWYSGMAYDATADETYYYIHYIDGNQFRLYADGTIYLNGGAFSQYTATSNYISVGAYGLYSSTYSAYFRRNDASSYAPWELVGAKGGYTGISYSTSNQPHIMFNTSNGNGGLYYQTNSRWILYYDYSNNSLGVGGTTTDSTYKLYVNGNVRVVGTFNLSTLITNGAVYSIGGGLTNTNPSDIRLKEDINPLQYGLKEVMALNPVTYKWKDGSNSGQRSTGLIAQDVQEVMPEYVKNISEDSDFLGLDSYAINIVLINAIKELKAEIEILKNK